MSLRSRRLKIAHRFIGGKTQQVRIFESVKRTTDEDFSRPLHGLFHIAERIPSSKLLGYFHSPATRAH